MVRYLFLMLCLLSTQAIAHSQSTSYLQIKLEKDVIAAQWAIPVRPLQFTLALDENSDQEISESEARRRLDDIAHYALQRLQVVADESPCIHETDQHTLTGRYAVIGFRIVCAPNPSNLAFRYALFFDIDPSHRGLVRIQDRDQTHTGVFGIDRQDQIFELGSPNRWLQFRDYLKEGIWHIWKGYDHVLFLLMLLLPAVVRLHDGRWTGVHDLRTALFSVFGVVSTFTVAHSITLIAGMFGLISVSARWVEALIAASIIVTAGHILRPFLTKRLWLVVFTFGLIHGLGFAGVLKDLGLPKDAMALSLLAFNAGVEIGQLALVFTLVPLLFALRHTRLYRYRILPLGAGAAAGIAGVWLVERLLGFDILGPAVAMVGPEKAPYGLLVIALVGTLVWGARFLYVRMPMAKQKSFGDGIAIAFFVFAAGVSMAYMAVNIPLTNADMRAVILRKLPLPSGLEDFQAQWETTIARLQKTAPRAAVERLQHGDPSEAISFLRQRLDEASNHQRRDVVPLRAVELALLQSSRNPQSALATLESITATDNGAPALWRLRARLLEATGHHQRAAAVWRRAIETTETNADDKQLAALYERLADAETKSGNTQRAETAYRTALGHAQAASNPAAIARLYTKLGEAYLASERLAHARGVFLQALALYQAQGNTSATAAIYEKLGHIYTGRYEFSRAQGLYELALDASMKSRDVLAIARQHTNLADTVENQGAWSKAEEHYRQALSLYETSGAKTEIAVVYSRMARAYRIQHKLDDAERAYMHAIAIDEDRNNEVGAAINYANLGIVLQLKREFARSEAYFNKALALNRRLQRRPGEAANYANLGNIYRLQGKHTEARAMYAQSSELFESLGATEQVARIAEWTDMNNPE